MNRFRMATNNYFQDSKDAVPTSVEQRVLSRKAFDREKPQLEAIIKQSDVEFLTIDCNVVVDAMKDNTVHKLDAIFRYKAVDYFTYEEEDQEEEEEEEGEEEVNNFTIFGIHQKDSCFIFNLSDIFHNQYRCFR